MAGSKKSKKATSASAKAKTPTPSSAKTPSSEKGAKNKIVIPELPPGTNVEDLTVKELQKILTRLGENRCGLREELIERVQNLIPGISTAPDGDGSSIQAVAPLAKSQASVINQTPVPFQISSPPAVVSASIQNQQPPTPAVASVLEPDKDMWLSAGALLLSRVYPKRLWVSWSNPACLLDPMCWCCLLARSQSSAALSLRSDGGIRTTLGREIWDNLSEVVQCLPEEAESIFSSLEDIALLVDATRTPLNDPEVPFRCVTRFKSRFVRACSACAQVEIRHTSTVNSTVGRTVEAKLGLLAIPLSEGTRELANKVKVGTGEKDLGKDFDFEKGQDTEKGECKYCHVKMEGGFRRHFLTCPKAREARKKL